MDRPAGSDPVPDTLDWDIWLGPAPMRPYKKDVYNPFIWRGWQDFGTGALGDMACHTVNMPFRALNLGYPTEIEATAFRRDEQGNRIRSVQRSVLNFPRAKSSVPAAHPSFFHHHHTLEQSAVTLWWYDGGQPLPDDPTKHDASNKPPREITADIVDFQGEMPGSGCLLIGDNGTIFSPDDYGEQFFIKLSDDKRYIHYKKHPAVAAIPESIPRNPFKGDNDYRQHQEWIAAIKENKPELCYSRFAIGAQLAEIMLLGCVSLRVGKNIEWDGPNMRGNECAGCRAVHQTSKPRRLDPFLT